MKRILSLVGAPALLMGLVLVGSAGFNAPSTSSSTLNTRSDTISFSGIFTIGGSTFTIHSTSCSVFDSFTVTPADGVDEEHSCTLAAAGQLDLRTGTATGTVAITGRDGTFIFHQTGTHGCAVGSGFEVDPGPTVVPVRIEGLSSTTPISANQLRVTGSISVYEAGGPPVGNGCFPD